MGVFTRNVTVDNITIFIARDCCDLLGNKTFAKFLDLVPLKCFLLTKSGALLLYIDVRSDTYLAYQSKIRSYLPASVEDRCRAMCASKVVSTQASQ